MFGRPPPRLRAHPAVAAGERPLAWCTEEAGGDVVATDQALWAPGARRLAWSEIGQVSYRDAAMQVTTVVAGADDVRVWTLRLVDPGRLPEVVRARVEHSIAWSQHHPLAGGRGGARVVARRDDRYGLVWSVVYDAGTDPGDPLVRAEAQVLLSAARANLGG